jgi:hypothetical protein
VSAETARVSIRPSPLVLLLLLLVLVPGTALAKGGQPDVRASSRCGGGVTADLRLRAQDDRIRVRFQVEHSRAGVWNIVLVHERRIAWRGTAKGSFEIERALRDYPGSDAVTARATGPSGAVCQVTGVISQVSDSNNGARGVDG